MKQLILLLYLSTCAMVIIHGQTTYSFPGKLPSYFTVIDTNAWKPNWDKDKKILYYIEKTKGDVVAFNLSTKTKKVITNAFNHSGFEYCLSLINGDMLLCGNTITPTGNADLDDHRQEMWILPHNGKSPLSLGEFCDRSPAVSRVSMNIAWTLPGQMEVCAGKIVYSGGTPQILNKRKILSFIDSASILRVETQDFLPPEDSELLITGFTGSKAEPFNFADVFGYNLKTGSLVNYSRSPGSFNEARGVSPDGKSVFIESDRHLNYREWKTDIYKLMLDGSAVVERFTSFTSDFPGSVVENPVVSHDGKYLAFQLKYDNGTKSRYYILLLDLMKYQTIKNKLK